MEKPRAQSWSEARALVRDDGNRYIIVKSLQEPDQHWEFPGGRMQANEATDDAVRRLCREQLDIGVEILATPPPFVYFSRGRKVRYCYALCSVMTGEPQAVGCAEFRWVLGPRLCEFFFEPPTDQVVDWLRQQRPQD